MPQHTPSEKRKNKSKVKKLRKKAKSARKR